MATKNWAGPVKFDPGQVKILIDYIRMEIFWTFLGDLRENFSLNHCNRRTVLVVNCRPVVSPTQLCWRYHSLPLNDHIFLMEIPIPEKTVFILKCSPAMFLLPVFLHVGHSVDRGQQSKLTDSPRFILPMGMAILVIISLSVMSGWNSLACLYYLIF